MITLAYSVCLVTGEPQGVVSLTQAAANGFGKSKPKSDCATTAVP